MPWTVKIFKKVDSMECPYIWRSPIEQLCTYNAIAGDGYFLCKNRKDCPIVIDDMENER